MVIFTFSVLNLFLQVLPERFIWHFDITWLVFQQFTRRDLKPAAFPVPVFSILAFNEITLNMTFAMAFYLYHRCKYVVNGSYEPPIGNYVITCEPKLPYIFGMIFFSEVVDQTCHSFYNYDGVLELTLL